MARTQTIEPERRAAILADVRAGTSPKEVAETYGVSVQSVLRIRDQTPQTFGVEKQVALAALTAELMEKRFRALIALAELATDREWARQQSARDLAVFVGVTDDKLVRVLGAIRPAGDSGSGTALPAGATPITIDG